MTDPLRHHTIRESTHRILDPFSDAQLATLGGALHLRAGGTVLDLGCGKGEHVTYQRPYLGWGALALAKRA